MNRVGEFEKVSYEQFYSAMKDEFYKNYREEDMESHFNGVIQMMYDGICLPERATSGSAGYALLLLSTKNKQLSTFNRCVVIECWELKRYAGEPGVLSTLNFIPTLINHIAVWRNLCCCRKFHHNIVKRFVDLLFNPRY